MAKGKSNNKIKTIQAVTYKYTPTGRVNKNGYPERKRTSVRVTNTGHTSMRYIGQKVYKDAKRNHRGFVKFKDPQIECLIDTRKDGTKYVTYYRRAK